MYNIGNTKWANSDIEGAIKRLEWRVSTYVKSTNRALYSAAVRRYGTWVKAVEKAGFDYNTEKARYKTFRKLQR